jgi:two-component system, NtrC family, response regulator HydG
MVSTRQPEPYLLVRSGVLENRQFRLVPGQVTTIGRAPTNRIAVPDEICSRHHCEVFFAQGHWKIRDCDSRNGTRVDGELVSGDAVLLPGNQVQLGGTILLFTFDPSQVALLETERQVIESDTQTELPVSATHEIVHRTRHSRLQAAEAHTRDKIGRDLARLYRLAIEMGDAEDPAQLSTIVLDALLSTTHADLGAVLLLDNNTASVESLKLVGIRSRQARNYERVSESLSKLALTEGEAILARDVVADSRLNKKDSVNELSAQSVICAPIRNTRHIAGLIHLYALDVDRPLDEEELDFTVAVAHQLGVALEPLLERERLADGLAKAENENRTLREQLRIETELVGDSPAVRQLREKIGRIAPTDATVLIRGESGVGKELVARAIHLNSQRRSSPFITMNCAALSESLLESELFGHEKGSFTGAVNRKLGKFEQAHGGTLFLDEVGEMSAPIQAKFLRILEGHPFERVGGASQIQVDVRVVAATNRALELAVRDGVFRKDLYFRLQVVELAVVPLRERRGDIAVLANFFLEKFARKIGRPVSGFSPAAIECLTRYDWPGNVRELQNTIERAVILSSSAVLGPADLQLSALGQPDLDSAMATAASPETYRTRTLDELEQEHILATLDWTQGNKSQAAQLLGIERSTLDRKLKRYEAEPKRLP